MFSPEFGGPEMSLRIDPPTATFPATGGNATHNIVSLSESRLAFKVKHPSNIDYHLKPVYGFLDAKATTQLEVTRLAGPAKDDKLFVQWAEVSAEETDPQAPFKAGCQEGEVMLLFKAE